MVRNLLDKACPLTIKLEAAGKMKGERATPVAMEEGRTDVFGDGQHRDSRDETSYRYREMIQRTSRRSPDRKESPQSRREKTHHSSSPDRKERTRKRRNKEHDSSDWDSADGEGRTRKRRRKKYEPSNSDSAISGSTSSASSSCYSSDEERHKIDRKRRDRKRKSSRRGHKEKSEEKSSKSKTRRKKHRNDKEQDSEAEKKRRLVKEAKKLLKRHKEQEQSNSREILESGRKLEKISADDYFLKSKEFATWLKEDRGVYFSDLTSKETHEAFEAFVDKWNGGRLHSKYYDGIEHAPRTNHNWAVKKGPGNSSIVDKEEEYDLAKQRDSYDRKMFHKDYKVQLDEDLPKATGREAQMEKKAIRREQARLREASPPELMKEKDIMGGGDDFQQRLAREKARREKKQSEKMSAYFEKSSAFEEKETATMEQFRALVNVAGGKITMAKRQ